MSTGYDSNMSALGWFFRKKSPASNTPRTNASQELRQLCNAVERISWDTEPTDEDASSFFELWVNKIREQGQYGEGDIYSLIDRIKTLSNEDNNQVKGNIKAAIVALIILAKKSTNLDFRNKVIELAKSITPN